MRLKSKVEKQLCKRVLKDFLDVLILSRLESSEPMSGYDFAGFIRKEFSMFFSTGTIYSNLYALEREGFIKGYSHERKRVYEVVDKGSQFLEEARHAMNSVQKWIEKIMKK